jgi:hypothetical protein
MAEQEGGRSTTPEGATEELLSTLERALVDTHEALFSYGALGFQPSDRGGKTIDLILKEALRAQAAYRLKCVGAA